MLGCTFNICLHAADESPIRKLQRREEDESQKVNVAFLKTIEGAVHHS